MNYTKFACAGGNRNPNAADWSRDGTLAFGAGNNVAIWRPIVKGNDSSDHSGYSNGSSEPHLQDRGVEALLSGHTGVVNAVKFLQLDDAPSPTILITGSSDKTIRIWSELKTGYAEVIEAHDSSVNCIATAKGFDGFISGSADGTIKTWKRGDSGACKSFEELQRLVLKPKYLPLAIAIHQVERGWIVAAAGTKATIQVYVSDNEQFSFVSTLTGHEGWVRSLAFTPETSDDGDLLLASASQDKYVRLWRLHKVQDGKPLTSSDHDLSGEVRSLSLSNKAHRIRIGKAKNDYTFTFEALLLGHEDWVYTAAWRHHENRLQLLTASADNSLAVWEVDRQSGVWLSIARLGEVSAQKGATTATGSTGGFWIGLWAPDGRAVASLGRTGSWRLWTRGEEADSWRQQVAVTGHVKEVKSLAWSPNGDYLLSTGSDQTTRLFAEWRREGVDSSWHEFSRPQIHGYDINCIDMISETQFVSGADEKLLRVFNEPQSVAELLHQLCDIQTSTPESLPDAANIPVLGLSNKAINSSASDADQTGALDQLDESGEPKHAVHQPASIPVHPPTEDQLARHMLWPEHEKLYGHGYEISTVGASHDGSVVATACKASSVDHAVIRLYETKDWREIKPSLKAHSLTVHSLRFSPDDQYLLSVGRDRQWTVFKRAGVGQCTYVQITADPKGHSRMILDCAWAPVSDGGSYTFATAGRDKLIKLWGLEGTEVMLKATITAEAPVTAVDFLNRLENGKLRLSYGTETGNVSCAIIDANDLKVIANEALPRHNTPSGAVTRLAWRPSSTHRGALELAVASDDHSIRMFQVV